MRRTSIIAILCLLSACSAPTGAPGPQGAGDTPVLPVRDGTYVIHGTGGCGDGAHFEVHNRTVSFTSIVSGQHAEGPVNPDGSFDIATPGNVSYGVTRMSLTADGTGMFDVQNRFRPCSGKIFAVTREQ
jgi:hypothetical protein